ncbi:hypothetical protein [Allohahella sp. A8]|uniref:hypothetical protein n=1 Tax=Allohahella sp. A8 TaxID=3141461 RepID=UPI003A7F9D9B
MSQLEKTMTLHLRALKVADHEAEYRFAAQHAGGTGKGTKKRLAEAGLRDWRLDFAWPELQIAAEIEGGTWVQGRHSRGKGMAEDCRKYNAAARIGWTVFRFVCDDVTSGHAAQFMAEVVQEAMGS